MHKLLPGIVLLSLPLPSAPAARAERSPIYPFDVKIDGQPATISGNPRTAIFAKIKDPVPANAELEVSGPAGRLIINIFPVKPNGVVPPEAAGATKILLVQSGTKTTLDATMDGSTLAPGLNGANVVFNNASARVMFKV
jgi:hypothetical protein